MESGDVLLLMTDGFFEWARSDDEQFGQERVCELVKSCRELPCAEIIQRLYREVLTFAAGTPQQDDLTAILIKRRESTEC
jgi:sigma-B regulation protein RsbU (phosphoserine phosphatase)